MKLWALILVIGVGLSMAAVTSAESDLWDENEGEILLRSVRGTKERSSGGSSSASSSNSAICRYVKGQWSECDPKTNIRTRTLNLKKGDNKTCEQTKTIQKKCKKACRYEKGTFSSCVNMSMTRVDNLKPNSDPTCEPTRRITKRCKQDTNTKKSTKAERGNKKSGKQ